MPEPSALGRSLKSLRTGASMTSRGLATKAGVAQSLISELETGVKEGTTTDVVHRLALALATTPAKLLGDNTAPVPPAAPGPVELAAIESLHASDLNPRKTFPAEEIEELAASIAAMGLIQPLTVRAMHGHPPTSAVREVYVGGKRLRALRLLHERNQWPTDRLPGRKVPVIRQDVDDRELLRIAVAENVNRTDMHPLEEGEAFAAMLDRDADLTTAAIGAIYGKTERWVQERVRIARNIADTAREAFRAGRMTLAQARALSRYPMHAQDAVARQHGDALLSLPADRITALVATAFPPVACALFDRNLYNGAVLPAEGSDEERFADVDQFRRLQTRAIADRMADLRRRWAWVERVSGANKGTYWEPGHSAMYLRAGPASAKKAGAILLVSDDLRTVKEFTGWVKVDPAKPAPGRPAPKDPVEAVGPSRRAHATAVRTRALQAALLANRKVAMARACLALMGAETNTRIKVDTEWRLESALAPAVRAVLDDFAQRLGPALLDRGGPDRRPDRLRDGWPLLRLRQRGADSYVYTYWPDAEVELPLFEALLALSWEELLDLHTALIAARTGAGLHLALGDSPLTLATAAALGLDMVDAWRIDEAYLAHLKGDELHSLVLQVNLWCSMRSRPTMDVTAFLAMKTGDRRSALAAHVAAHGVTLVPPEMAFVGTAAAHDELRAAQSGGRTVPPVQLEIETAIASADRTA